MPDTRECARCRRVLVDQDELGWYYQQPVTDPKMPGLTFMDRVHECDGKPHEVIAPGAGITPERYDELVTAVLAIWGDSGFPDSDREHRMAAQAVNAVLAAQRGAGDEQ